MRCEQLGVRESSAGDRRLYNQFLLPDHTFRRNERLPACGDGSIRPGNFDRRLRALFDLRRAIPDTVSIT